MNKKGCLLFISVLLISTILFFSVTITVRKTPNNTTRMTNDSKIEQSNHINNEGNNQFPMKQEMLPAQNSDFKSNSEYSSNQNILGRNFNSPTNYDNFSRYKNDISHNKKEIQPSISENIKSCQPYKETLSANIMGVDTNYALSIEGWQKGKCILLFKSSASPLNSEMLADAGIDAEDVQVFTPKIRCEFTRDQLEYVGDSILEEKSRNTNPDSKMLKDPNSIELPNKLQASDLKLIDLLVHQKACKIMNLDELNSLMKQVTDYFEY